jgi:hypothetical protein
MSSAPARIGPDVEQLRARLNAAADWGREKIAHTRSPCSRDLAWYLIQLAEHTPDDSLAREVKAAEALWRAAMEVERIELWGQE